MIVVPIDGSNHSLNALEYAVKAAESFREKILLVNVQQVKDRNFYIDSPKMKPSDKVLEKEGETALQKAVDFLESKVEYDTKIRIGVPSIEIANEARDQNASAIIMGSRGNGPVVSQILGSVSYGVLHLSSCPVTIVPGRE
ncbi:universal stress protein [Alkalicoccus daliensis]|uniref:Nucleotide-binding universal stress protein, UspA family n=1 Tax=Alkalicoccus daliensis TaxID=745820 RepID=A0A1G9ZP95_9BACI|nr:universal stress protein [Alkalicoccus daliensis]SDN23030.1 Nucleotide-binding universal stress protein, UspA family [Alkalicoccus daliensis]